MAVNCWLVPAAIEGLAGVTVIDDNGAEVTVRDVDPVTDPELAEIVVDPAPTALPSPHAETVATAAAEELHAAVLVRSCELPSL
jgi:hypothetical protein